jgi:signal transduction histidine kinase/post-segregation antitoxin (ccd killing protein)
MIERERAEEVLLKAGALQSAIFNSANFSSIATDAHGVIQIFNVGAERMLGYTAAEVMNKVTPADISDPQELIARAAELSLELGTAITPGFEALVFKASRGIEDIYELTYCRKDGSRFPAVVSVTALRDAQNTIIGYLLIGTDNSARKQAEEALLKAGALQSAIFNSANFSSIATDAHGVIQIFNVGAERMLGYTAAEVMNKVTPADISDPQELIARAAELSLELGTAITPGFEALVFKASRGIEDIYELTYIRKDGSRFPAVVSVTALRDAQNAIIGYLLIGTDNTARKQAEEALLKAGALQSAIFNSANFSSIATDAHGVIQIFNVGAERMLGYAAADVMNTITPADISDPQELIARAAELSLELGTPITPGFEALVFKASRGIEDIYELTYIRKDGSRFPAVVSVTALRDAQNAIIGYLLIGTDNTARKHAEEALLRSEMLASAGRMAASIAHEINNPLEAMMNTLYLARKTDHLPEAALEYLDIADGELMRIAHITRQTLGFYREFSAATSISTTALIDSVISLLQSKIKANGARVEQQGDTLLQVMGIAGELRQVMANLLANSLDAIGQNGRIVLRASASVDPDDGRRRVRITVSDQGSGMPAPTMKEIFEPFFTTKGSVGTGLGLWVCKQLVEKNGGSIRVRSNMDGARRGTTFSMVLPGDAAMHAAVI